MFLGFYKQAIIVIGCFFVRYAQKTSYNIDVFQKCLKDRMLLYLVSN